MLGNIISSIGNLFSTYRHTIREHGIKEAPKILKEAKEKKKELDILNIQKDNIIREKFHSGFKRTRPVVWFVIHGTAGGGTLNWMRKMDESNEFRASRYRNYKKGIALFHYLIERDGTIVEIINPDRWVYHASVGAVDGGTIGVELLNPDSQNRKPYTQEQYEKLADLYEYLRIKYPQMTVQLSHNRAKEKVSGGNKACPGTGFKWTKWRSLLKKRGWKFEFEKGKESVWNLTKS